jgi:hypothetical protein
MVICRSVLFRLRKVWDRKKLHAKSKHILCSITFSQVLLRVKEQRNILHEISKRKANWIGHILRRNCLLRQVIKGKIKGGIEVTGRRRRRRRKLLDDLKERKEYSHMKEEALDRTVWRACFGRGFGPVVRQTTEWMNEWMHEWIFFRKWNDVEEYCSARQATDNNIIRPKSFACWITKATNTHSEYIILIAFPLQHWLQ